MLNIVEEGLTFDDVLLVPRYSEIESRSKIDLSVELSKGILVSFPVIPANMKTIIGPEMMNQMCLAGGMSLMHRFAPLKEQFELARQMKGWSNYVGFSVGVKKEDYEVVDEFAKIGAKILCIDIAHGHSKDCLRMTKYISQIYPDIFLIAGNVATGEGAVALWENGADACKVNVGAGSACTTRIETGNGYPQLSALSNVWDVKKECEEKIQKKLFVIADGGMSKIGDCVKSLCFSDLLMSGLLFSGCDEVPGEIITIDGQRYKKYVGSSTHKTNHIEGVEALVKTKGPVKEMIQKISEGIRSGLSYQGSRNLVELKRDPKFVRITGSGLRENGAHDITVIK